MIRRDRSARVRPVRVASQLLAHLLGLSLALAPTASRAVGGAAAAELRSAEYDLKATFLFNFTQFIEWPSDAFGNATEPFVLGVVGADPFGGSLDTLVVGERINGHPIVVKRYPTAADLQPCHVLFIPGNQDAAVEAIFSSLETWRVLTVGESEAFAARGGAIRFLRAGEKLRLRIDLASAENSHLTISSQLLRQADVVGR